MNRLFAFGGPNYRVFRSSAAPPLRVWRGCFTPLSTRVISCSKVHRDAVIATEGRSHGSSAGTAVSGWTSACGQISGPPGQAESRRHRRWRTYLPGPRGLGLADHQCAGDAARDQGPSLYNHVDSLEDLRRAVRIRVIDDIITMLNRVGEGRAREDAVLVMAGAYRSYAHHHPGRYSAFTRMPLGGDDPEYATATRGAAAPVMAVLNSYGLDGEAAFHASLEFWSALHGFVLLEMTGVMDDIDTDALFSDMVLRLAKGLDRRTAHDHAAPN